MGRAPCCDKSKVKRGPWSPEEDTTLKNYLHKHGTGGNWIALPNKAGLKRCGKSCRLRWLNYLRPDIKHGGFTEEEDNLILAMYNTIGSRWSIIASRLPGRTDNDVKNHWNTKLKKKLFGASSSTTTTNDHDQINGFIKNSTSTNMSMAQITHFDDHDHAQLTTLYPNFSSFSSYLADNIIMGTNSFDPPPPPQYYQPQPLPGLMEFTTDFGDINGSNCSYNNTMSSSSHEANSSLSTTNSTSWFSNGDHLQDLSSITNLVPNGFAFQENRTHDQELAPFLDNNF